MIGVADVVVVASRCGPVVDDDDDSNNESLPPNNIVRIDCTKVSGL
jgi:hypothetical protein